jgi:flagellar protein FlgJ
VASGSSPASGSAGVAGSITADSGTATDAAHAAFVQELWPSAVQAGQQLGVDPRTLIAHAALETGWGQSMPGNMSGPCSNNLFGIKASAGWSGASVASRTVEFDSGVPSVRTERFRAYASAADCFQDYVALLQGSSRYAGALGTGSNAAAFGTALQQGGYATDPHYAAKLAAVANALKQTPAPPLTPSQGET